MLVLPLTVGSPAFAGTQVLWAALRTAMTYMFWAVTAALVASAVCWCCGAGARAAWSRIGPPAHRSAGGQGEPDEVAAEAERGIREIEAYLTAMADPR